MRLLIKTSLKLLLVFVEYNDANGRILIEAVKAVDKDQGRCYLEYSRNNKGSIAYSKLNIDHLEIEYQCYIF